MRRLLLITLLALVLPSPALAKELSQATVCGADGCNTITDRDELRAIVTGGDATMPPAPPGRYYSVELTVKEGVNEDSWTIWYAPGPKAVAVVNEHGNVVWHPVSARSGEAMRRAARGVQAFPAPRVTSVRIGDRVVTEGAASYLSLFAQPAGEPVSDPTLTDWVQVDLRSARPTPWTASDAEFTFSAAGQALERSWELVALPEATADAIAAGEPLGPAADGRNLLPWLLLAVLAAAILVFAGLGRLLRGTAPVVEPA